MAICPQTLSEFQTETLSGDGVRRTPDAVLLRCSRDFADLAAYRRVTDEVTGRHNAKFGPRIDAERAALKALPGRRTIAPVIRPPTGGQDTKVHFMPHSFERRGNLSWFD
jgi:hypothetical protein